MLKKLFLPAFICLSLTAVEPVIKLDFEKIAETLNEEKGVYSISIPGYRKLNNFGIQDCGVGYYCEVYDDRVIFKARKFISGEYLEGDLTRLEYKIK